MMDWMHIFTNDHGELTALLWMLPNALPYLRVWLVSRLSKGERPCTENGSCTPPTGTAPSAD